MIKGILFDKDGTLIEFMTMWHQVMTYIFDELEHIFHMDNDTLTALKHLSGYGPEGFQKESMIQYVSTTDIISQWYQVMTNDSQPVSISRKQLMKLFEKHAVRKDIPIQVLEGVERLLQDLKSEGYYLGIATADTLESAEYSLKKAGIYDYFHYIGADDGQYEAKPSPQMAHAFCQQMSISPEALLIVGDSVTDMLFAQNSGAHFIGLETPYNDSNQFIHNQYPTVDKVYKIMDRLKH